MGEQIAFSKTYRGENRRVTVTYFQDGSQLQLKYRSIRDGKICELEFGLTPWAAAATVDGLLDALERIKEFKTQQDRQ